MAKLVKLKVEGLKRVQRDFNQLRNVTPAIQTQFMRLISQSTLRLLRANTPVDTGELKSGWTVLGAGRNYVDIGFRQRHLMDRLIFVTEGTQFHPGNPFLANVQSVMLDLVMDTLTTAMKLNHKYFKRVNLRTGRGSVGGKRDGIAIKNGVRPTGKGRKYLAVGRTKATMTGSRQVGGAQVKRVGRGGKAPKGKVLSLRRRRGKDARTIVKALLG